MTDYLSTLSISIESFYKSLREEKDKSDVDYQTAYFIDCLIASTTYESFYKVMVRAGIKRKESKILEAESKYDSNTQDTIYDIRINAKI